MSEETPPLLTLFVGAALGCDAYGYAAAAPFVCAVIDEQSANAWGRANGPIREPAYSHIQILLAAVPEATIRAAGWVRPGEQADG